LDRLTPAIRIRAQSWLTEHPCSVYAYPSQARLSTLMQCFNAVSGLLLFIFITAFQITN